MGRLLVTAALLVACDACERHPATATTTTTTTAIADAIPSVPCGALDCAQYDSPGDAFRAASAGGPLVLAIGEAHAPRGASAPSAAHRFTEELLPLVASRASDLLLELMMPPAGCAAAAAEVRKKEAPATSQQAPSNQSEYVTMGERAKALGIVPDMLRPSCADMDAVRDAGGDAIEASLDMIARLTIGQAGGLLDRDARSHDDAGKMVVVYGGMLHNDLTPPPEQARWSYATALDARVHGRLVAVDLVVPEFIVDDAVWRALPWVQHYDRARLGARTTLFRTGDRSFVLVFPETRP